jgi:chromosome segregation ATPase
MDFTKALDELKRVREFLSAVAISEETMRQVATLGDEVVALGKKREALLSAISTLSGDYTKAKAAHDAAMGRLASEKQAAQSALRAAEAEIEGVPETLKSAREKVNAEIADIRASVKEAETAHAVRLSEMASAIAFEQKRLDEINAAVRKIAGMAR